MTLMSLAVPIAVVVGIVMLIVRGYTNKNPNGKMSEEDGAIMLKNIYTYLVLFATLMMIGANITSFAPFLTVTKRFIMLNGLLFLLIPCLAFK